MASDGVPHQVRELGEALGLPTALVWRQPFPGPGLAIRVLCADAPYITPDFDAVQAELVAECAACSVLPVKPVLLPVRTVGVQGDGRSYSYLAALTMAHSPHGSWPQLLELAQLLPTKVHQVNRVCFLMGAPLEESPREITPTCLYSTNGFAPLPQLRAADKVVNDLLLKYGLLRSLAQVPVTLFPVGFGLAGGRSIGIRAFITRDFMTGRPACPGKDVPLECLDEMVAQICAIEGIARVALDITPKPPATTEWE